MAPTAPVRRVWGFRRKYTQNVKYMWGTSVESIDVDNKVGIASRLGGGSMKEMR